MFEEHGYNIKEISVHRDGGKVFHLDNVDNGGRESHLNKNPISFYASIIALIGGFLLMFLLFN